METNLGQILREKILKYKAKHPKLSSVQLAKRFGLPNATLHRIENLGVEKPSFDQVLKILRGTENIEDLIVFLQKNYPELGLVYQKVYSSNINTPFIDPSLEHYFENPQSLPIILLTFSNAGTTKDQIKEEFGNFGLKILDDLLKRQVVKENADGQISVGTGKFKTSQKTAQKMLQLAIQECYDLEAFGLKDNWLSFQSESVNKEKILPILIERLKKVFEETKKDFENPLFAGEESVFLGLVCDTVIKSKSNTQDHISQGVQ